MTTTGFVPATRDETAPTGLSRFAAGSSVLLGATLGMALYPLAQAAFYVGVLAAVSAVITLVAGSMLWSRASVMLRATAALGALATLAGLLLLLAGALPGTAALGHHPGAESLLLLVLGGAVVVCLLLDTRHRRPEDAADHPYAL